MFESADPDYIQVVEKYLESQRFIVGHENSMNCSLWRPPETEDEEFSRWVLLASEADAWGRSTAKS